jgi:hypothetical protein
MKRTAIFAGAFALMLWTSAGADQAPVIEWQKGKCLGGLKPSEKCKTCESCWYCGRKGRYGARPENSGTCVVCEKARAEK